MPQKQQYTWNSVKNYSLALTVSVLLSLVFGPQSPHLLRTSLVWPLSSATFRTDERKGFVTHTGHTQMSDLCHICHIQQILDIQNRFSLADSKCQNILSELPQTCESNSLKFLENKTAGSVQSLQGLHQTLITALINGFKHRYYWLRRATEGQHMPSSGNMFWNKINSDMPEFVISVLFCIPNTVCEIE